MEEREMSLALTLALATLSGYKRFISPILPPACRFHPSCSDYGYEALQKHGLTRGLLMTMRRLSHCHPFHPGGFDPVE